MYNCEGYMKKIFFNQSLMEVSSKTCEMKISIQLQAQIRC